MNVQYLRLTADITDELKDFEAVSTDLTNFIQFLNQLVTDAN